MENLTYATYLTDPAVRAQLERAVRRARAEAMHEYLVRPLARMLGRALARNRPIARLKRAGLAA